MEKYVLKGTYENVNEFHKRHKIEYVLTATYE